MATSDKFKTGTAISRRTIASYSSYAEAERAVDWLSDQGFAVEHQTVVLSIARRAPSTTRPARRAR